MRDEGSRNDDGRVLWRQMLRQRAQLLLFLVVPHPKREAAGIRASSSRKGGRLAGSNVHEGKGKEKEKERRKMIGATKCPS